MYGKSQICYNFVKKNGGTVFMNTYDVFIRFYMKSGENAVVIVASHEDNIKVIIIITGTLIRIRISS